MERPESRLLLLLVVSVVEDENTADEGRLKRSSLTGADDFSEGVESVVLLADTGAGKVCLQSKDRPPPPVENLQRPPHGLINMYPFD